MPNSQPRRRETQTSAYDRIAELVDTGEITISDAVRELEEIDDLDAGVDAAVAAIAPQGESFYPETYLGLDTAFSSFANEYPVAAAEFGSTPSTTFAQAERRQREAQAIRDMESLSRRQDTSARETGEVPFSMNPSAFDSMEFRMASRDEALSLPNGDRLYTLGNGYDVSMHNGHTSLRRHQTNGATDLVSVWNRDLSSSEIDDLRREYGGGPANRAVDLSEPFSLPDTYSRRFSYPPNMRNPVTNQIDRDGTETRFRFHNRSDHEVEVEVIIRHVHNVSQTQGAEPELATATSTRLSMPGTPLTVGAVATGGPGAVLNTLSTDGTIRAVRPEILGAGGSGGRTGFAYRVDVEDDSPEQLAPNAGTFWGTRMA